MLRACRRLFITLLLFFFFTPLTEASEKAAQDSSGAPIDVVGKVVDHHELAVGGMYIPLPRILLVDGEWYFYGSTESAAASDEFMLKDEVLVPASGAAITLDMSITSHLIYVWFGLILTLWITIAMARKYKRGAGRKTEPEGWFQNLFEIVFMFVRDDIAKTNIPDNKYQKFVPYLFTVFVGITFMNLFGLLPWGATATADITVTAVLATFTFVITQWNGSKDHWKHVFWFPGVPGWMRIILTPIEIIGLVYQAICTCRATVC
ncbi:MAG: F0F1 ATP synthase subunit A [Fodinibius sp.]|nr:F0F1 ATP synthase subunit A [Fodinibius sp.]